MKWKRWFAWYPVKLENNDYAKISGEPRWIWLSMVYTRRIYTEHKQTYPGAGHMSFDVYSDLIQKD